MIYPTTLDPEYPYDIPLTLDPEYPYDIPYNS
jgi:hypothetical protein